MDNLNKESIVNAMCITWRHDFWLDKRSDEICTSGMTEDERESLRRDMGQLFDHHIAPLLEKKEAAK